MVWLHATMVCHTFLLYFSRESFSSFSLNQSEAWTLRCDQPMGTLTWWRRGAPFYRVHSRPARWSLCFVSSEWSLFRVLLLIFACRPQNSWHIVLKWASCDKKRPRLSLSGNDDGEKLVGTMDVLFVFRIDECYLC